MRKISAEIKQGRQREVGETLVRLWDGLEVVDATFDLVIHLEGVDYTHAKARNIFECAFIQATRRLYGTEHAIFTRTVAYVDLVMEDGIRRVYRFELSNAARKAIKRFDKAKNAVERQALAARAGTAFVLREPSEGRKLESIRRRSREHLVRKRRRRLLVKGQAVCVRPKKGPKDQVRVAKQKKREYTMLELSDVRNATGRIQFRANVAPSKLTAANQQKPTAMRL